MNKYFLLLVFIPISACASYNPSTGGSGGGGIVSPATFTWVNNFGMSVSTMAIVPTGTTTYALTVSSPSGGPFFVDVSTTGHFNSQSLTVVPTVTSCGTGSPTVAGSDIAGTITLGGGAPTSCTLNFANPFTNSPVCLCEANSAIACGMTSVAANAVTFTLASFAPNLRYICIGRD